MLIAWCSVVRPGQREVRAQVAPACAHALCEGHFPGAPLLPGAYLAGLMVQGAALLPGEAPRGLHPCTFLSPVLPTQEIVLTASTPDGDPDRVKVALHADGRLAARGTVQRRAPAPVLGWSGPGPGRDHDDPSPGAPGVEALLPHRGPALLVASIDAYDGAALACGAVERPSWSWPELLEAAVQGAGLLAGLSTEPLPLPRVVAAYEQVRWGDGPIEGPVVLWARHAGVVGAFRRLHLAALDRAGRPLVTALATLSPARPPD